MSNPHQQQDSAEVTLGLLRAIDNDKNLTQRSAAHELGVALGLINTYVKRCVKKGFIKVRQAPSSRYMYYLTPKGFAEKSRLSAEFVTQSLSLFRQARSEYHALLEACAARGWNRVALYGVSDLTELVALFARDFDITIIGVVDAGAGDEQFHALNVYPCVVKLPPVDAYIVTALQNPQTAYDDLIKEVAPELVLVPNLLDITPSPNAAGSARR